MSFLATNFDDGRREWREGEKGEVGRGAKLEAKALGGRGGREGGGKYLFIKCWLNLKC